MILIATDIFGINGSIRELQGLFQEECHLVDPYEGKEFNFRDDEIAYEHFIQHGGLEGYVEALSKQVALRNPSVLVGFSAGASAVWLLVSDKANVSIRKAICFYSAQIRSHLDSNPLCETQLIFPNSERSFSVDDVMVQLQEHPKVTCTKAQYSHGFMNRSSKGYNQIGYYEYSRWLVNEV